MTARTIANGLPPSVGDLMRTQRDLQRQIDELAACVATAIAGGGGGGGSPSGPAGGDLTGTYPNPTLGTHAATTLGLGTAAGHAASDFDATGAAAAAQAAAIAVSAQRSSNLSDLGSAAAGRANLGTDLYFGGDRPGVHGFLGWTLPILSAGLATAPSVGVLQLAQVRLAKSQTVSTIWLYMTLAGSGLTHVGVGLWSNAGAKLQASIDANGATTTAFATAGLKPITIPSQVINDGDYVGFWFSGTTAPTLSRANPTATNLLNAGLSAPTLRFATADTGLTATAPSSFGTQTGSVSAYWAAVS